ncbi:MAG: hypothetical protein ACXIUQ_10175 [Cecembia sp.]
MTISGQVAPNWSIWLDTHILLFALLVLMLGRNSLVYITFIIELQSVTLQPGMSIRLTSLFGL